MVSRARSSRSRSRCSSAYHSASFRPKVIGSAWTPCVRPIIGVRRCSSARARTASIAAGDVLDDQVAGLAHLQRLRGVDDVGGGQAEVQPARRGPDLLGDRGREGDHVVLRGLLRSLRCARRRTRPWRAAPAPLRPARCRLPPSRRRRRARPRARSRSDAARSRSPPSRGSCTVESFVMRASVPTAMQGVRRSDPAIADPTTVAASCWPLKQIVGDALDVLGGDRSRRRRASRRGRSAGRSRSPGAPGATCGWRCSRGSA